MEIKHYLTQNQEMIIYQDSDLNSYTFDSLLLAHFTNFNKRTTSVIDLCAGNAPIAMLLTRKKSAKEKKILGIEIQECLVQLANKSIKENNLEDQIEMINDNLKGINKKINQNYYDVITCNPPFFKIDENSNLNKSDSVSISRHEVCVTLKDIISESRILLNNMGSLNIVYRPERLEELFNLLREDNFAIKRLQFVYPSLDKPANHILIEAKKGSGNSNLEILKPLIIYDDDGNYTKDALEIINQ